MYGSAIWLFDQGVKIKDGSFVCKKADIFCEHEHFCGVFQKVKSE